MTYSASSSLPQQNLHVQTFLALLHGDPVTNESAHYGICRSDLYKFRSRALIAIGHAVRSGHTTM